MLSSISVIPEKVVSNIIGANEMADSNKTIEADKSVKISPDIDLRLDSILVQDKSINVLKLYLQMIQAKNYESKINLSNRSEDILTRWKYLRDKDLLPNPIRLGREPNTSGVPLPEWRGYYIGLIKPPSDTLWGLSRMDLDSLKRIKSQLDTITISE
jgi:hypothetical protein